MNASQLQERVARAGHRLSDRTIAWGKRPETPPACALTERDIGLIALLYDVNFLSASQLTLLGWGRDSDAAGKRLLRLHDSGYLDKFRSRATHGSSEWNYRLTRQGWQALQARGVTMEEGFTPRVLHSISYAEHDLELNSLILTIAQTAAPQGPRGLLDRLPFIWQGPRTGRIDPSTTPPPPGEASKAATLPPDTQFHPEQSRPGYLEPDATLTAGTPDQRFAVLVEYDRTARPHKQVDRLRRYDHWLLEGWRHTPFATHAIPPAILYITAHEQPLSALIQAADRTLSAWHGPPHATAMEGVHPARQRILFTSRVCLEQGDWRMRRVPNLLPSSRKSGAGVSRPIDYDLPALLTSGR